MEDLNTYIARTGVFFQQHFKEIAIALLPLIIPLEIYRFLIEYYGEENSLLELSELLTYLPEIYAYPIYQCTLIIVIASKFSGEDIKPLGCYKLSIKFWPRLLFLYIIIFIAVAFGTLLFIIPGIILSYRLSFAELYAVLHNKSALDSLSKSWRETKLQQWIILKGFISIGILVYLPPLLIGYILNSLDAYHSIIYVAITIIESFLSSALFTIFIFHVYASQQSHINNNNTLTSPGENA